jgi:hypothetical protein
MHLMLSNAKKHKQEQEQSSQPSVGNLTGLKDRLSVEINNRESLSVMNSQVSFGEKPALLASPRGAVDNSQTFSFGKNSIKGSPLKTREYPATMRTSNGENEQLKLIVSLIDSLNEENEDFNTMNEPNLRK